MQALNDWLTQQITFLSSHAADLMNFHVTIQNCLILSQKYSDFAPKQWAGDLMTQQELISHSWWQVSTSFA